IDALGRGPLDYLAELDFIHGRRGSQNPWHGGSVLLPLYYDERVVSPGEYVFLLNKRSKTVQQPGDLCAPGGGIHPLLDSISEKLLGLGLFAGGPGLAAARTRGKEAYRRILFLLGNALRESWEELRLSPFNVEFLGPLPTYRLQSRRWIIFPLAGRVKDLWKPKLSWEVEKIVRIPLSAFFDPGNYAVYCLEVSENLAAKGIPNPWEFPCLVQKEENGEEEILWGATFNVIETFFRIVFDFSFPVPDGRKVIRRPLARNYISGREKP
ncbi:MAG TPA: hypothetical protein VLS90_13185, partial [Thermodesulfobacteriota bacterium]|nr:hypothetical protein [Thermodesulfobacteriota bacterium]